MQQVVCTDDGCGCGPLVVAVCLMLCPLCAPQASASRCAVLAAPPQPLSRLHAVGPPLLHCPRRTARACCSKVQLERCATGLDGGCVYGGHLVACILPPLDEQGAPQLEAAGLPPDAHRIELCSGLPGFLVSVPARQVWVPPGR